MEAVLTLKPQIKEFLQSTIGLYIDGKYVQAQSGKTLNVLNPANEEVIAVVSEAQAEDIDLAVHAAQQAFEGQWSMMEAAERSRIIYKLADLLEEHREELAQLESLDNGKPYKAALADDVDGTVQHFRYYAGWATKITGQTVQVSKDYLNYIVHEPVGVVGQIIPWNFPLAMAAWKLGAALAVGCTVVIKPAAETPLSLLYVGQLMKQAGFPDGVVNIVPGTGEAGEAIVTHKGVAKVAFTGSTKTGIHVMKKAADDVKSITLELGGKSPAIVLPDADVEEAIEGTFAGTMYNHGQNCSACTRVFVHSSLYNLFIERLAEKAKALKIGSGLDPETDMGPLVSQKQLNTVLDYIEKGKEEGARIVAGGDRALEKGYFVQPTIFADVQDTMIIAQEEIFGPVMSILSFETVDEVIVRANNSKYGLAASIWTENVKKAHYIASKLQAGTVWINDFGLEWETMPFGGYKQSGIGREMGGEYGLSNYTEVKSVFVNMKQ
ncbi:aldehyde dehydrogenase family protein [Lysinibacillus sphaericus]|nr:MULTISPECIES: aldehyde dehydrogenase family protein [Lysinibacillus]MBE5086247.1 aldehyde dehydrogenase family protein [Bacillus thuringiensis]AMO31957.1 betaine-aldehyde dehydrogenase [Lysinibacillus sphaericus]AMR88923.1 betaine-aldehyde dehydrogenase [Lysinibacillus sphaericus]ANA46994.1 betaine-aldehyde dehydrogenase [Lysinibacillus sphaericus]KZL46406.1 betaine-aldehyde dehydrogenase [Lysinibacillus sphaericus]